MTGTPGIARECFALREVCAVRRGYTEVVPHNNALCPKGQGAFCKEIIMDINEKATKLHQSGFNCAQSVLCACGDYTRLDEKTALAISAGFGGGIRSGEICGAISGAVMAIGVSQSGDPGDPEVKAGTAAQTKQLVNFFREKYGCVRCLELKKAGKSCTELIENAARMAEEIIGNK